MTNHGVSIATQNVGGYGRNVGRQMRITEGGAKKATLERLLKLHRSDVLVLTETRIDTKERAGTIRLNGLKVIHSSCSGRAAGGVSVLVRNNVMCIENSHRESRIPGYFSISVCQINNVKTIIGGVYLDSSNRDETSWETVQELWDAVDELKTIY